MVEIAPPKWTITIRWKDIEKVYSIATVRVYDAKIKALSKFIRDNNVDGKPYQFLGKRRNEVEISIRSSLDRRTLPRKITGG